MIKRLDISMLIENAHKAEGHRSFTLQLPLSLLSSCCVNTVASVTKPGREPAWQVILQEIQIVRTQTAAS